MNKIVKVIVGSASLLPFLALAVTDTQLANGWFGKTLKDGGALMSKIVTFLIAVAIVWFVWNVIKFTMATDEDKKGEAKTQMIWGIVALAVILSIWGLVSILQGAFGITAGGDAAQTGGGLIPNL